VSKGVCVSSAVDVLIQFEIERKHVVLMLTMTVTRRQRRFRQNWSPSQQRVKSRLPTLAATVWLLCLLGQYLHTRTFMLGQCKLL